LFATKVTERWNGFCFSGTEPWGSITTVSNVQYTSGGRSGGKESCTLNSQAS